MLSSRLKAFVIPTSQMSASTRREHVVADDLDGEPAREHDPGRDELGGELQQRAEREDVVREPREEEERCSLARIPSSSDVGSTAPTATASSDARDEAGEDSDAAEDRCRALVPALAGRLGHEPLGEVGAQERPENECRDGQRRERDDRAHERKA